MLGQRLITLKVATVLKDLINDLHQSFLLH